jgi:hypothetical protein
VTEMMAVGTRHRKGFETIVLPHIAGPEDKPIIGASAYGIST